MMPTWGIYLGGAALLLVTGFTGGWQIRDWKADSDELEAVENAIELGKDQQELADYQAGRYEDGRDEYQAQALARDTEIRTIYRTERIEVPIECEPDADALRVLQRAVSSANAQVAGEPGSTVSDYPSDAEPIY